MSRFILFQAHLGLFLIFVLLLSGAVLGLARVTAAPPARPLGQGEATPTETPSPTATVFSPLPTPTATGTMTSTGGLLLPENNGAFPELRLPSVRGFGVSEKMGAATVDYPLTLPPGPGGFAPSLALSYSSSNVDDIQGEEANRDSNRYQSGLLGLGWDISGIARQSPADWEVCSAPSCTPRPGKALARVISISGIGPSGYVEVRRPAPWSNGADWYQSPASAHLAFAVGGDNPLHVGRWETHFTIITDTNSIRYQFSDANKTFTCATINWPANTCELEVLGSVYVNKITNAWGQEINFYYASEWGTIHWNGQTSLGYTKYVRPTAITYGANQNIRVDFVYFDSDDQRNPGEYYYCGDVRCDHGRGSTADEHQDHFTDYLLKQIKISVEGQLVRTYDLDYYTGAWNWYATGHYYNVNESGVQVESYHALLKSITEKVCHREGSTDVCVEAGPPHTFKYAQLPYQGQGTAATKNDILLTEVNNGYNGRVQFFYDDDDDFSTYTPRAYHVVTFKEDGSTTSGDRANRWRFIVTEKRVFDGKGRRYDILYRYFRNPFNRADGFVDVGEAQPEPIEMPFRFLGFLRSEVETYDFVAEDDLRPPTATLPLNIVISDFHHSLESYQGTQLICYRPDPRAPSAHHITVQAYENGSIVQPSQTWNLYHFSRSTSGEYDRCEKRLTDPRSSNQAFVREPLPLLVQTIVTQTTGVTSVATLTQYRYQWDFQVTGHQSPANKGALEWTWEYGRLDVSGDERTTHTTYFQIDNSQHIFNLPFHSAVRRGICSTPNTPSCDDSTVVRRTAYFYDTPPGRVDCDMPHPAPTANSKGALTAECTALHQSDYLDALQVNKEYDLYGNVSKIVDARGVRNAIFV